MNTRRDFLRRAVFPPTPSEFAKRHTETPKRPRVMWLKETIRDGCTTYFPGKVDVAVYPHLKPYCRRVRKGDGDA